MKAHTPILVDYKVVSRRVFKLSGTKGSTLFPPSYFHFHSLKVVYRYRDAQLQVSGNYSYFFKIGPNICKS